jgi:membrane associated rhomboid family serine protease
MGLRGSPTVETLVVFVVVFVAQAVAGAFGLALGLGRLVETLFVLGSGGVVDRPWTLFTSVYAHAGVGHLVSNAIALALVGFVLERHTTRGRFHVFFLVSGALAGVAQVWVGALVNTTVGGPVLGNAVLGASGAVLALYGYVLGGNRVTDWIADCLGTSPAIEWVFALAVAAILTYVTASAGVALVAHFTGVLLGVIAGRLALLEPATNTTPDLGNASYK